MNECRSDWAGSLNHYHTGQLVSLSFYWNPLQRSEDFYCLLCLEKLKDASGIDSKLHEINKKKFGKKRVKSNQWEKKQGVRVWWSVTCDISLIVDVSRPLPIRCDKNISFETFRNGLSLASCKHKQNRKWNNCIWSSIIHSAVLSMILLLIHKLASQRLFFFYYYLLPDHKH